MPALLPVPRPTDPLGTSSGSIHVLLSTAKPKTTDPCTGKAGAQQLGASWGWLTAIPGTGAQPCSALPPTSPQDQSRAVHRSSTAPCKLLASSWQHAPASGSPPGHGGKQQGLGALSPRAMQALVRARQWRHCYYTWPHSPFKALEDELCFIYIKEAISEPICDQICCQRNFALSHYI